MLGQLNKILEILDLEAGLKVEKSGGVFGEEDECGDVDVELLVRERRSLDILSVKKEARPSTAPNFYFGTPSIYPKLIELGVEIWYASRHLQVL